MAPCRQLPVSRFIKLVAEPGPFRTAVDRYFQAITLQIMQGTACNALHGLEQRCSRWLLQTHDRVGADEFQLKHEFLAIMLGTTRPWVTKVIGALQKTDVISSRYGRIAILDRKSSNAGPASATRSSPATSSGSAPDRDPVCRL